MDLSGLFLYYFIPLRSSIRTSFDVTLELRGESKLKLGHFENITSTDNDGMYHVTPFLDTFA